ncbi:redox-sensitive transcriptional activator SoxR [Kineococcus rhizosphaerae]|uniref:MerR family redox-sensitive transcriptional activator SoxR n=1 Tax=Kineococcus rhizosphaerae TaxID=559628 RepID=A0A2T0QYP1_9ACTN|nr:redox-sensitive transcriptional activator SoxR [Kineococcus rhizosphaerae]PRY11491.1 MerR family redox-sensitive transcriptional activator SoxR [Kineococcus rhizosphaerae]
MSARDDLLSIGTVAARAGLSVPALRYYEERGLLAPVRDGGGRRRFPRHVLRRLAVIAAGQRVGLSLKDIGEALATLPADRAPSASEWARVGERWQELLDARIRELHALRTSLDGCIGCGCLSLTRCTLFNPHDAAAEEGAGSRWLRDAENAPR